MRLFILILMILSASTASWAGNFTVTSTSWQDNATMENRYVFDGFGCSGENASPQVSWNHPPDGTKSFAVTVYDPDAPTGSGWWHWTVFNIPAETRGLAEGASQAGALPPGTVEGRTDFGKPGYGGACPPPNDKPHRYILTVFALNTEKIDLPPEASGAMVGFYLNQNTIEKASLTALYDR